MIITKSISRFARNTLDCLKYIRELKDLNIPVFFEKESINTMDSKGEVLLTIMASLAQQESQSLSQNVKLGIQYRYQQGKVQINHNRFLGYTKDADGNLVIDPEQAEIVRRIYREYLQGLSMYKIAAGLEADGILNGAGNKKWYTSTINKILRNEKYIGDALLQKTYTTDFLTKKRVKNTGHACHSRTVNETVLEQVVIDAINQVLCQKDDFLKTLRANIATVVLQGDTLSPEVIDERLNKLQKDLLKKVNQKDDYDAIADEILRLRDQRRQAEVDNVIKDEQMKQINDLQDFIKKQPTTITEFDEALVGRLISKITVYHSYFTVEFKSGVEVNIEG